MTDDSMLISPCYTVAHWKALKFSTEEEWQKAIDIFNDRIHGRFLEPISRIEAYTYAGFAVLALDCLLIETLEQFHRGVSETPRGKGKGYFVAFLTRRPFNSWFDEAMAKMFYEQIRCGILHQAEVKGSSIILKKAAPLAEHTADGEGLVINRERFHQQLAWEIEDYMASLKDPANKALRANFRKKMDCICRVSVECD